MARAGVSSDIAERVLGHVIPGVRGVYDRHSYITEKLDALEKLAALISKILNPPRGNGNAVLAAGARLDTKAQSLQRRSEHLIGHAFVRADPKDQDAGSA